MNSRNQEIEGLLTSATSQLMLGPGVKLLPGQHIIGIGVDLCEVPRMERDIQRPTFKRTNFTATEIEYCEGMIDPEVAARSFAARYAAKEAVIKALGGIEPGFSRLDINVLRNEEGKPFVLLTGASLRRANALGATSESIFLSMSHVNLWAISYCTITNYLPAEARC